MLRWTAPFPHLDESGDKVLEWVVFDESDRPVRMAAGSQPISPRSCGIMLRNSTNIEPDAVLAFKRAINQAYFKVVFIDGDRLTMITSGRDGVKWYLGAMDAGCILCSIETVPSSSIFPP